jgi:hypothetical protein
MPPPPEDPAAARLARRWARRLAGLSACQRWCASHTALAMKSMSIVKAVSLISSA